jgi:glycosyltransferase involved in cell wall biosynthesis
MCFAHMGKHLPLDPRGYERKIEARLARYGTISKSEPVITDDAIRGLQFGVVHIAFGQFKKAVRGPLKNGTTAEIARLVENPFRHEGSGTSHLLVTFDDVDRVELSFAETTRQIVVCRIPDFLYAKAKRERSHQLHEEYLALQVLAGLDLARLSEDALYHFHSWESGVLLGSRRFLDRVEGHRIVFSPYLTVGRLRRFMAAHPSEDWTLDDELAGVAERYERLLVDKAHRVVVESKPDKSFYAEWSANGKVQQLSFVPRRRIELRFDSHGSGKLSFVAGGRPVTEKGFLELCGQLLPLARWARGLGREIELLLLCREDTPKRVSYVSRIERMIDETPELRDTVRIEARVSEDELRGKLRAASALIVPSLFDPFCLMPDYAAQEGRVSFVSCHAGVSSIVKSKEYVFDPTEEGDLLRAVRSCHEREIPFIYENSGSDHTRLYLDESWGDR